MKEPTIFPQRVNILNKIILFLVEGKSDETSLALTLNRLLQNRVKFFVIKTDITSDCGTTVDNIKGLILEKVSFFLTEYLQFQFSDIDSIIQITDTDGVFVDDSRVVFDETHKKIFYSEDSILTDNVNGTIYRNKAKAEILRELCSLEYLENNNGEKVKYRIYYMSSNLEHVLHNLPNVVTDTEKETLAKSFRNASASNNNILRDIVFTPSIECSGTYEDSWSFIQKGTNSIKRKTNFSDFFNTYIDT